MATTDLGKWMITNGGEYNPNTTYEQLTMVLYQNSTYITLRTVTGIIPNNDKINYILMAQGFSANALGDVVAKDTYGVIGDVGGDVSAQNLVDYLTNEVVNNLLKKTSISTVQTNSDNTVPSSSLAYKMQQAITKNKEDIATANSNLEEGLREAITESDFEIVDVHTLNNYAFGSAVRCGRMVIVCFSTDSAASTPGKGTIFTLPENFRPPAIRYGMGIFSNASNTDSGLTNRPVYVDISGNVCNPSSAAVYRGGGTIVYIK